MQEAGPKKRLFILHLQSSRVDKARVCRDHLVKLEFCVFVITFVTTLSYSYRFLYSVTLMVVCFFALLESLTDQQYTFYGAQTSDYGHYFY